MTMLPLPDDPFAGVVPHGLQFDLPKTKKGMFGGGNLRDALMAAAAGFMARRSPQVANNLFDSLQRKQILADQEAQYQRRRQDSLTDYEAKQQIDQQYPTPHQPGEFEQVLMASGVMPGTPEWTNAMKRKAELSLNPIVMTPYGPMPYSTVAGAMPTAPVGKLTPIDDGGPTAPPSATFPRSY
jgi:alpha-beta hydrolase superfamily lysophospholipase